jgi:RNA polymerase sigma-70 factor (ECF subfamily)
LSRSLNLLKKRKLRRYFSFSENINVENIGQENVIADMESRERLNKMEKLLMMLPVKQREVFIMRNYDDLSYEEIAGLTGKSIGALKANYFYAFRKMKELMEKDEQQ